jgi:MFS family permease
MVVALGTLTGPSLGGFLTNIYGWPSIFLINIPIGILGGALSLYSIPLNRPQKRIHAFDEAGSITFVFGVVLLFFALLSLPEQKYPSVLLWSLFIIALLLLAAFVYIQKVAVFPLIQLELFNNPVFSLGISSAYISFLTMTSVTILIPFYLQDFRGLNPMDSGLIMTAYPISLAVVAPLSGCLSDIIGYGWLTTGGLLINTIGLISLATLTPVSPLWSVFGRLMLMGVGMGMFQSPNNSSIMSSAPKEHLGVASSINNLVRNLGMISGITFATTLFSLRMNRISAQLPPEKALLYFVPIMTGVFAIAAIISGIGVVLTLFRTHKKSEIERVK